VLAVAFVTCLLCALAHADSIESTVRDLSSGDSSYKVRLAATLALGKSHDPRAVIAVSRAVRHDDDPTIRRVAALSLEKMVSAHTAEDARELAIDALEKAAASDDDQRVRDAAAKVLRPLAKLRPQHHALEPAGDRPQVFVNVDTTTDQSRKVSGDVTERLTRVVKRNVEKTGYSTSWPGGLPSSAELSSSGSRAFIVASTVKHVEITKAGSQTQIACTVAIRVAPWTGRDGGEHWEANRAANASGSAKATTGSRDRDITNGVRDCVEAVAEDVTARQVVPFLTRVAQN
jgi:hypothetical protein